MEPMGTTRFGAQGCSGLIVFRVSGRVRFWGLKVPREACGVIGV